jgi:hypothetical protein
MRWKHSEGQLAVLRQRSPREDRFLGILSGARKETPREVKTQEGRGPKHQLNPWVLGYGREAG